MCKLYVKTKYSSYEVIHPMRNLSSGEDYALDVFPMADRAEYAGSSVIDWRFHRWYSLWLKGEFLGVKIAVPMAS
jgi:hypothetical protein